MCLNQLFNQGQTDTETTVPSRRRGVRLAKTVPYEWQETRRYAFAGVLDLYDDPAKLVAIRTQKPCVIDQFCPDHYLAAGRSKFYCVRQQVPDYLLESPDVYKCIRKCFREIDMHFDTAQLCRLSYDLDGFENRGVYAGHAPL